MMRDTYLVWVLFFWYFWFAFPYRLICAFVIKHSKHFYFSKKSLQIKNQGRICPISKTKSGPRFAMIYRPGASWNSALSQSGRFQNELWQTSLLAPAISHEMVYLVQTRSITHRATTDFLHHFLSVELAFIWLQRKGNFTTCWCEVTVIHAASLWAIVN